MQELSTLAGKLVRPVGMLLLVVGAGPALTDNTSAAGLPIIVLAQIISCALRTAQGSATGGVVGPLITAQNYSKMSVTLNAMAIEAASIIIGHVNDGEFWIIAEFSNAAVKQTLHTWTELSIVNSAVPAELFTIVS
jgi:GntP family gluconate:H+ symporter